MDLLTVIPRVTSILSSCLRLIPVDFLPSNSGAAVIDKQQRVERGGRGRGLITWDRLMHVLCLVITVFEGVLH